MSMTRNDALHQLAAGIRKFEGWTAQQLLDSNWPGLMGFHHADILYFRDRGGLPLRTVARCCQSRNRYSDGGLPPVAGNKTGDNE